MDYFPLFVRLTGTPCLLIGGGSLAHRKLKLLLRADADVTVLAPEICSEIIDLAATGRTELIHAAFTADLIEQYQFIIAATSDAKVNAEIAAAAAVQQRFCNVVDDRELSSAIVPAVVDRSPVLIAISTGGSSPVLATQTRLLIEQWLNPGIADLARFASEHRQVVKETLLNPKDRLHFWQHFLSGPAIDLLANNDVAAATQLLQTSLSGSQSTHGMAWVVGAGPGDPELLTLKAARVLRDADVIMHDRLVNPAILDMARRDAEFISVGKQAGQPSISQTEINQLLIERVAAGNQVCRLKGGDPFIFGRGGEEIAALDAAGLPWQVIPGITAASGCAAAAGIPLTHRHTARSVTLTTASTADGSEPDWSALSGADHTVVFYMGLSKTREICTQLIAAGRDPDCPAAIIENGSTRRQRLIAGTISALPDLSESAKISSPALLIVGEVTALAATRPELSGEATLDTHDQTEVWSAKAKT